MVLRGTEANRTACAMHSNPHPGSPSPHYYPIIFRESPYCCSFCSLYLYLSVSTALRKSDADWGSPRCHHQRAAWSCAHPDQPLRSWAPPPASARAGKPNWSWEEWCWASLLLRQSRKGNVPFNQGTKRSMSVSLTQTMTHPKCIHSSHSLNNR